MAQVAQYKKYNRGRRQAIVETDFSKGMMFTENVVSDGYVKTLVNFDYSLDGTDSLKPRAAITTSEFIFPDMTVSLSDLSDYNSDDTAIKYSKECVESGYDYRQFIFGKLNSGSSTSGKVWVLTSRKGNQAVEIEDDEGNFNVIVARSTVYNHSNSCKFYSTELSEIHGVNLSDDAKTAFPVGCFLGNSFYFFNTSGSLCRTVFNNSTSQYEFVTLTPKTITASEAVNYGYNMLSSTPYSDFVNGTTASTMQFSGILPYDNSSSTTRKLLMTPKKNTHIYFESYYDVITTNEYVIKWSWKETTSDEWIALKAIGTLASPWSSANNARIEVDFNPPSSNIMLRCEAYRIITEIVEGVSTRVVSDVVEKAITVGFDFSIDEHGTISNINSYNYNLSNATGMISWKNRLILWGVPEDTSNHTDATNILFISDLNEPTYFPYPNNITVFDEPIISVTELMDNLIVFTKTKVYQVSVSADGTGWTASVIQSNLHIEHWDKHLIQTVRNMLYFKSGNYYYMMVPKRESDTGELTLAPITTPITDFFNNYSKNVDTIFRDTFKDVSGVSHIPTNLVTYFNFLDYEFIHNMYVYKYFTDDNTSIYVHFDVTYNVVDRYWKICIYEAPHILYPFRNDATQKGLLASTSVITVVNSSGVSSQNRVVQLYKAYDGRVKDFYLPSSTSLIYDESHATIYTDDTNELVYLDPVSASYSNEILTLKPTRVNTSILDSGVLELLGDDVYSQGFNTTDLKEQFKLAKEILLSTTIFTNKQYLDTGYRDAAAFVNKRSRELQLQINNINNVDMEFGMDFRISGENRNVDYLYEVSQSIDEIDDNFGVVFLDSVPYLSIDTEDINKVNQWTLKHNLDFDVSMWKVRASVSGKGVAPRLRLFTRNQFNYQLLGINWVYREMNMR